MWAGLIEPVHHDFNTSFSNLLSLFALLISVGTTECPKRSGQHCHSSNHQEQPNDHNEGKHKAFLVQSLRPLPCWLHVLVCLCHLRAMSGVPVFTFLLYSGRLRSCCRSVREYFSMFVTTINGWPAVFRFRSVFGPLQMFPIAFLCRYQVLRRR